MFWKYISRPGKNSSGNCEPRRICLFVASANGTNVPINILIDRLAQHDGKALLVIDDLHTISNAQILKGLSHLLEYLPINAHVIIISRAEPAMELHKFELRSQVLRITANDLRFRQDEISDFYRKRDCTFGQGNY